MILNVFLKNLFFRTRKWNSRSPFMEKSILNFHFDYWNISLMYRLPAVELFFIKIVVCIWKTPCCSWLGSRVISWEQQSLFNAVWGSFCTAFSLHLFTPFDHRGVLSVIKLTFTFVPITVSGSGSCKSFWLIDEVKLELQRAQCPAPLQGVLPH